MSVPTINVQQLSEALTSLEAPQLLDVREPSEITASHLPNILQIPLGQLAHQLAEGTTGINPTQPVAVICRSGGRSATATMLLLQEGFIAANVAGGMLAYRAEIDPALPPVI